MSRRNAASTEAAANQATEAARVLQARSQEARQAAAPKQETLHLPSSRNEPAPESQERKSDGVPMVPVMRGNAVRDAALDQIRRSRPGAQQEETEPAPAAEPAPTPKADAAPQQEPAAAEPAATIEPPAPDAPKLIRVKVDGVESDVPEADIEAAGGLKSYQIQRASENRLAKVNEALAQTRQAQEAIVRQFAQNRPPPAPVVTDDAFLKSKMDAILYGTPDEKATAFQEAIARVNPRIDQNALIQQATTNMKRDLAVQAYRREFSDVVANPLFAKLSDTLEREALAGYVQNGQVNWQALGALDWQNFYSTIGTQIRGAVPRQSQPQPAAQTTGSPSPVPSEREARKTSIVEPPKAAAARATLPEEPKPETREESLNAMRRARGQPAH